MAEQAENDGQRQGGGAQGSLPERVEDGDLGVPKGHGQNW